MKQTKKPRGVSEQKENVSEPEMVTIFKDCQYHSLSHDRLCRALKKVYDNMKFSDFCEDFLELTRFSMITWERSVYVDRTADFIVKFILYCCKVDVKGAEMEDDDQQVQLLVQFLQFCIKHHTCATPSVRYRCVQFLRKLLDGMGDEASISEELFQQIQTTLLKRVWDVKTLIRVEATNSLARLQDPTDRNCPIVMTYLHVSRHDTCPEVRKAALISMAVTTMTLPAVVDRCRDVSDVVRKKAYEILTEKGILKPLKIETRIELLRDGLNDRSPSVVEACVGLLKWWFQSEDSDPIRLLKRLDVEESKEVTEVALRRLLKDQDMAETVDKLKETMLTEQLILKDEYMHPEGAFYWRVVCAVVKDGEVNSTALLEKLLPTGNDYCAFLKRLFKEQRRLPRDDPEAYLVQECLLNQVMEVSQFIDLTDEFGRRSVLGVVRESLASAMVPTSSVEPLLRLYRKLEKNETRLCESLVEIISELRDPDEPEIVQEEVKLDDSKEKVVAPVNQEAENKEPAELDRKTRMKLASITVKLNELNEEMQDCLIQRKYDRAGELLIVVSKLQEEKSELLKQAGSVVSAGTKSKEEEEKPKMECDEPPKSPDAGEEDGVRVTQSRERDDPEILLKCNTIAVKMLKGMRKLWTLTPCLRSLVDSLILPSITCPDPAVRNQAVTALGLCCVADKPLAVKYMPLFTQIVDIDHETIQASSLRCIIDCFLMFGLEVFQESQVDTTVQDASVDSDEDLFTGEVSGNNESRRSKRTRKNTIIDLSDEQSTLKLDGTVEDQSKLTTTLLAPLINLLDSQCTDVRSVCTLGLSKLLLHHKVVSPKLISRLLLLWYNPITEEDKSLRHYLAMFFSVYACSRAQDQAAVGEAVLPTLKTLFRAPASSPLSEVEHWNVALLLMNLTDAANLLENQKKLKGNLQVGADIRDNPVHDDLALRLCNEILNAPNAAGVKVYVRMVSQLRLSPSNTQVMKDLLVMLHTMGKKLKDRMQLKMVERLRTDLKAAITRVGDTLTPGRIPVTPGSGLSTGVGKDNKQRRSTFARALVTKEQPTMLEEMGALEDTYLGHRFKMDKTAANNTLNDTVRVGVENVMQVVDPSGDTPTKRRSALTKKKVTILEDMNEEDEEEMDDAEEESTIKASETSKDSEKEASEVEDDTEEEDEEVVVALKGTRSRGNVRISRRESVVVDKQPKSKSSRSSEPLSNSQRSPVDTETSSSGQSRPVTRHSTASVTEASSTVSSSSRKGLRGGNTQQKGRGRANVRKVDSKIPARQTRRTRTSRK